VYLKPIKPPYKPLNTTTNQKKKKKKKKPMSTTFYMLLLMIFFLFSSLHTNVMGARDMPSSAPNTIVRPLASEAQDYAAMKPQFHHKHRVFQGREVNDCLPKGSILHCPAPSPIIN
jgi:hypothetical protein